MSPLPPIRREVIVTADPQQAFSVFTDEISAWWPLAELSVLGPASLVGFRDGKLVEGTADGREAVWGEVHEWEPGRRLRLSWHPGRETSSELTITFSPTETGTLVVLEHSGWEGFADPAGSRTEYGEGWTGVLELYRGHAEPEPDPGPGRHDWTWVALMHTPGPQAPADGSLFDDPRFAEHVAFLQRMTDHGYLVAAGPFGSDGSGMTILRLPGGDRLAEATALAATDDLAVAGGLLAVSVRPWNVRFHSLS